MTDQERQTDYETNAQQPWRWHSAADNLFEAAAHLYRVHGNAIRDITTSGGGGVPSGFFMDHQAHYLEGKCIELYVKCLLVKSGTRVTEDGKVMRDIATHDLLTFCHKAGSHTTASEDATLGKLTEAIKFWGTYPIPINVKSWRPEIAGIEGVPPIRFWNPIDTTNYTHLVDRVRERIGPIEFSS